MQTKYDHLITGYAGISGGSLKLLVVNLHKGDDSPAKCQGSPRHPAHRVLTVPEDQRLSSLCTASMKQAYNDLISR